MSLSVWVTTISGGEGGVREGSVGEGGVWEGGVGQGKARHFSLLSWGEKASVGKEKSR